MIKAGRGLAAGIVLGCLSIGSAFADQPGADWMSMDAVKTKMQAEGYSAIVMEADDGHWEGEAVKDGRTVEFHADARTGAITKSESKGK